jgi:ATPase subunit of ABC transporter with duplicated ATPase domains
MAGKAKKKTPAASILEKLDFLEDEDDSTTNGLSKKELKQLAKQQQKKSSSSVVTAEAETLTKEMSKKEEMLHRTLELEKADEAKSASAYNDDNPKLSKKELKELEKKMVKDSEKLAKKEAKKNKGRFDESNNDEEKFESGNDVNGSTHLGGTQQDEAAPNVEQELTLEDKIRKERPPPRIRVMESSQPGYTSLRLENVGVTFRDQEVLKDVTWGVQTGDRIGLVGANGAGKLLISLLS